MGIVRNSQTGAPGTGKSPMTLAATRPQPACNRAWAKSHTTADTKRRERAPLRDFEYGDIGNRQQFGQPSRSQCAFIAGDLIRESFPVGSHASVWSCSPFRASSVRRPRQPANTALPGSIGSRQGFRIVTKYTAQSRSLRFSSPSRKPFRCHTDQDRKISVYV